jgi:hypothetical protein
VMNQVLRIGSVQTSIGGEPCVLFTRHTAPAVLLTPAYVRERHKNKNKEVIKNKVEAVCPCTWRKDAGVRERRRR